jgi:uncharacterized protein YvpB
MNRIYLFVLLSFIIVLSACTSNFENNQVLESSSYQSKKINEIETDLFPKDNMQLANQKRNIEENENDKIKGQEQKQQEKILLDVPLIQQNPELKYGCEVTSLTMLLNYAGVNVNKMQLADELAKDKDQIKKTNQGDITNWGDPNDGFVGDITGKNDGYAVFDKPLEKLMNKYMNKRTLNLTGESFDTILKQVEKGKPVVVWTTGDYRKPDRWESWKHGEETIETPLDLHAVVLVGYEPNYIYINDPLSGVKNQKVGKEKFIESWVALKMRALTYN